MSEIEIIQINDVKNCLTKKDSNLYLKVNNAYSCFEENLFETLKAGIGKTFEMDIATSVDGKWKNIRGIGEETDKAPEVIQMNNPMKAATEIIKEQELIITKDKPNSRTFGKGHDQVKIYFDDAENLEFQIEQLVTLKLMPLDWKNE